jgi:hypothetical protein
VVALGGLVLVVAAAVAALRARGGDRVDRRRAVTLALLVPVCGAATALTPLGPGLWRFVGESMESSRETRINEWIPSYPTGLVEIMFLVLAAAFVALVVRRRRRVLAGPWADQVAVAVALAVLPLAVRAVRNIPPFVLVALPASARLLGADFKLPWRSRAPGPDHPRVNLLILIAFALVGVGVVGTAWAAPFERLGWRPLPAGALAAARACPGNLYNRYNEGGYLIWFAPERRVFVDSRKDPYPLPFIKEAIRSQEGQGFEPLFARWDIRCALMPVESPLASSLRGERWRSLYLDDKWAVLGAPEGR